MTEVTRQYPTINEVAISTKEEYMVAAKLVADDKNMIPLFVKTKDNTLEIISSFVQEVDVKSFDGCQLIYIGKPISEDSLAQLREMRDAPLDENIDKPSED